MHNLFVYGTLKKNERNNEILKDEHYIGEGITIDKYNLIIKELPYLYKEPINNIEGDVYIISDEMLQFLDAFEGCPNFYYRDRINVNINNEVIECYIYFKKENKI